MSLVKNMLLIKSLCYNEYMKRSRRGGFTLIELALSLVFIAILSMTVVLLIQNTFRRGMMLNQVNTVGMDLIDDLRSSVQYATSDPVTRLCGMYYNQNDLSANSPYKACVDDKAYSFIFVTRNAKVTVKSRTTGNVTINGVTMPVYGAFCTGTYTYVWNSGYFDSTDAEIREVSGGSGVNKAKVGRRNGGTFTPISGGENFKFLKVYDNERSICVNAMKSQPASNGGQKYVKESATEDNRVPSEFVINTGIADANEEKTVDLLDADIRDNNDLVLYDFYVSSPAVSSTKQNVFYAASLILGTKRGGININGVGNSCKPPSDLNGTSELDYCAINKFNFAVQAGGE